MKWWLLKLYCSLCFGEPSPIQWEFEYWGLTNHAVVHYWTPQKAPVACHLLLYRFNGRQVEAHSYLKWRGDWHIHFITFQWTYESGLVRALRLP